MFSDRIKKVIVNNSPIIKWILINFFLILSEVIFCQPAYETNDDFGMGVIAIGGYGTDSSHLIFSNILLGWILKLFYLIIPVINWYIVLQYIAVAVCYSVVETFIENKRGNLAASITCILLWIFVIYDEIRFIQFTRTAYLLSIVGFLLLVESCRDEKKSNAIIGYILITIGFLYRPQCFWLTAIYIAGFLFSYLFGSKKTIVKEYVIRFAFIFILTGSLFLMDKLVYSVDEGWKEYTNYNQARAEVLDYGFPDYETNREKYEEIGVSPNDILTMSQWTLNDTDIITSDLLKSIGNIKEERLITFDEIKTNLFSFCKSEKNNNLFWISIIGIFLLFYNKRKMLGVVICFISTILFSYLYYVGRVLPRVEFGIWIAIICIVSYQLIKDNEYVKTSRKESIKKVIIKKAGKAMALVIACLCILMNALSMRESNLYDNSVTNFINYMSENDNNVYMLDILTFTGTCYSYKPYLSVDKKFLGNFIFSGGCESGSPLLDNKVKELGLDNPIKDLLYKDNMYYVTNRDIGNLLIFLQEHYDISVVANLVEERDGYCIYNFDIEG